MKLDVGKYGTNLVVIATISSPSSDAAEDPATASAGLYFVNATGQLVLLNTIVLVQQGGIKGVWGGTFALGTLDSSNAVVIAEVTIGGVIRSAVKVMGASQAVTSIMTIGAPQITVTPGPLDQNSKNATP